MRLPKLILCQYVNIEQAKPSLVLQSDDNVLAKKRRFSTKTKNQVEKEIFPFSLQTISIVFLSIQYICSANVRTNTKIQCMLKIVCSRKRGHLQFFAWFDFYT